MPGPDFAEVIRRSGLVSPGDRGVVMVSGGADSVALLTGLAGILDPANLLVLHVNYGLREDAGADEALVRRLCGDLEVECHVHRAGPPEGNTQAWAREIRHREAELLRDRGGFDWVAIGHNRTDQVETFLYRLASSPGVRPLLTMGPRSGHVIRPLLELNREQIRSMLEGAFPWVEDQTNDDPGYARNRIRLEVIPELEKLNPAAQSNISRTWEELREDDATLTEIANGRLLEEWEGPGAGVSTRLFLGQQPPVVRRMLRILAEATLDRPVSVSPDLTSQFLQLHQNPEFSSLDLGGGACLRIESGMVRVLEDEPAAPGATRLVEGELPFGEWTIQAALVGTGQARSEFGGPLNGFFEVPATDWGLAVRPRAEGDRINPLGMEGSKSLQDLFTDARIPASRRSAWPVVVLDTTVLWVPGLARSRELLIGEDTNPVLRLQARPPFHI